MAKNRADRYQTASEFADAFKRAVSTSLGLVDRRSTASIPDAAKLLDAARLLHRDMIAENIAVHPAEQDEDRAIMINTGSQAGAPADRGRRRTHPVRAEIDLPPALPRLHHHRWQQGARFHHSLPYARHHQRPAHAGHDGRGAAAAVARNHAAKRAHPADGIFGSGGHRGFDQRRRGVPLYQQALG